MKINFNFKYLYVLTLIVLFPFDQLFTSFFPNFSISPFRILFVLIALLFYKYRLSKLNETKSIWKVFLIYSMLALLSMLWSSEPEKSILYALQLIISIMFCLVAVCELSRRPNFYKDITFYTSLFGALVALLSLIGVFSERELSSDYRLSFTNIGLNAIAISIGYTFVLGITGIFSKHHSVLRKIMLIISSLIIFYFLMRTGTRSSIFGVLIALGIGYFMSFKIAINNVVRFIVALIVMYIAFNKIIISYLGDSLRNRIFSFGIEDVESDSRGNLWGIAYNYFSNNLLGTGAGNEEIAYASSISKEAHNIFVSSLLQLGFIGFFLMIYVSISLFIAVIRIKEKAYKFTAVSLYIFLLLQMMKGSFLQNRLFWIPIVVIFAIIIFDSNRKINNIEEMS